MDKKAEAEARALLATLRIPYAESSLADAGIILSLKSDSEDEVHVTAEFPYPARSVFAEVQNEIIRQLQTIGLRASAECRTRVRPRMVQGGVKRIAAIKNIIAVASAKGGVGKSATAVNIALALAHEGAQVGMLDADIYGPSLPIMLGVRDRPQGDDSGGILPLQAHGLQVMSIGFMVDQEQPMVWRGPIATRALSQLLEQTRWHDLDYLILDMPPGTGDIQLTAAQKIPLTGAVIVTTPQDLALADAQKGLAMFRKVSVPILGVVENMSVFCCPNCGHESHIFGQGAAAAMCKKYETPFLGDLPLDAAIRADADSGCPTVVATPSGELATRYIQIAHRIGVQAAKKTEDRTSAFPQVVAEK